MDRLNRAGSPDPVQAAAPPWRLGRITDRTQWAIAADAIDPAATVEVLEVGLTTAASPGAGLTDAVGYALEALQAVAQGCREALLSAGIGTIPAGHADIRVVVVCSSAQQAHPPARAVLEEGVGSMVRSLHNEFCRRGLRINAISTVPGLPAHRIGMVLGTLLEDLGGTYLGQTLRIVEDQREDTDGRSPIRDRNATGERNAPDTAARGPARHRPPGPMMSQTQRTVRNPQMSDERDHRHDPAEVEEIGCALAASLRGRGDISGVVAWDSLDDVLLGHIVARELGTQVTLVTLLDGRIFLNATLPEGPVVVVARRFDKSLDRVGILGVVANHGGKVVAVATVDGVEAP